MNNQTRIAGNAFPTTWIGRLVATIAAVALAVAVLFFLAIALIAATVIVAIVALRIGWMVRKSHAQRDDDVIEGSYSIESEQTEQIPSSYNTRGDSKPPATK